MASVDHLMGLSDEITKGESMGDILLKKIDRGFRDLEGRDNFE